MFLKKISLLNFKNIEQAELALCRGVNCLVGDNGAGKTNVIDAVYYLSMCKSSLPMTDGQSIRHGADFFLAEGQYLTDGGKSENIVCSFSRKGGKVLKRNGKEYERLSDHVGLVPAVIVSPADSALISDAADERRRYLNAFISQLDRSYLAAVMRYNAVLAERNRLLKNMPDETMLQIYDMQLVEQGERIHARRREFAERLQPVAAEYYRILSGDREQVGLHYKSELNDRPFGEILLAARQKDLVNEFTTSGIHRDDLVLRIGGYPLRKYGSQGQQKSFLIALKLAQYTIVAQEKGEKPILLLDDLFDKLDAGRVEQLIRLVSEDSFGQKSARRKQRTGRGMQGRRRLGLRKESGRQRCKAKLRRIYATRRPQAKNPAERTSAEQIRQTRHPAERRERDETDQDDADGRPAGRVFQTPLCRGQSRRREAARHMARRRGRPRRRLHHGTEVGKPHSLCPHPVERASFGTLLPARSAQGGAKPAFRRPDRQCGDYPVDSRKVRATQMTQVNTGNTEGAGDTGGAKNTGATANKRDKNTAGTENTGDTTKYGTHEKAGAGAETQTETETN